MAEHKYCDCGHKEETELILAELSLGCRICKIKCDLGEIIVKTYDGWETSKHHKKMREE